MSELEQMLKEARIQALRGSDTGALRDFVVSYMRKHDQEPLRLILAHLGEQLGWGKETVKARRQRCPECLADLRRVSDIRLSGLRVPDSFKEEDYICMNCQL